MIFHVLPQEFRMHAFIAGGWAACPALASDIDLWVPVRSNEDVDKIRQHIESRAIFYDLDQESTHHRTYPDGTFSLCNLAYPWGKVQIIGVWVYGGDEIESQVNRVLDNFDISTHQVAICATGEVIKGSKWTPVHEMPKVIDRRNAPETEARLKKICDRFGHTPVTLKTTLSKIGDYIGF